jgi:hypothetical protein
MAYLKFFATQQTIVWAVFSILAVAGILAQRRWGIRASAVAVILAWPVFVGTVLLSELRLFPQLLELNSFAHVFRIALWKPATIDTIGLAVALWLARRVQTDRRAIVWGVGSGAVWAYLMVIPLALLELWLNSVIPMGTAEYHYVDFRPMGLEVLESGTPQLSHYTGGEIPLRYRAELDGRQLEVVIVPEESYVAEFRVRAVTPDSPPFEVDGPGISRCAFRHVRQRDNRITVTWSTQSESRGICYGDGAADAEVTVRFAGSETSLTLHGPVVKGGEFYFYNTL